MPNIRAASPKDLEVILQWLRAEEDLQGDGFYSNHHLIKQGLDEGDLTVVCLEQNDAPVGFLLGTDILEVQSDFRGNGYGRMLAEFMIGHAHERGEYALEIECSPETSIPFWQRMGFTVYAGNRAYRKLRREISRPNNLPEVEVEISFFPEKIMWDSSQRPIWTENLVGFKDGENRVLLPHEVFHFVEMFESEDVVIAVSVDHTELYREKAKYDEARTLGVREVHHGFAVSELSI